MSSASSFSNSSSSEPASSETTSSGTASGSSPLVLVVEDDANQRSLYQEELADDGFRVITASDGREALEVAQAQLPDLVVLDVNMPRMDGLDTLSALLETNRSVPVIIHSAYASYQDSFASWAADAYIVKSSDLSELKNTARRLLASRDGNA